MNASVADHVAGEKALAVARTLLARELLESETSPATIGDVTLHAHQREAVVRIRALLRTASGALLADSTGLGKTFVALALAHGFERVLIIAPAALRESWRQAIARTRVTASFVSLEALSRGAHSPLETADLMIVDEAHHLRNPRTKCYDAIAALCARSRVLLMSATPLQNRRDDLVAQLAVFLGDAAVTATDAELSRFIVRRRAEDRALRLPSVHGPRWIALPIADELLDDLLALPPPVPGADEGTAGALVRYSLVRQWSSSRAALVAALRRRVARAVALMTSLEAGRWPSRHQLAAWSYAEQAVQLAFPEMVTALGADQSDLSTMLEAVRHHADALRDLLIRLRDIPDPDPERASALIDICTAHRGTRIIAFTQYAETVSALSRLLMPRLPGVAALTARGGRVAGGRILRRDVLTQFAPRAGGSDVGAAERIDLLVTTDVVSEGLDLQRASVVVHLDLPWNPARLEQRVGRVRRLGSLHDAVFVYALAPPIDSERMLRVIERLEKKLGLAGRTVGLDSAVMPGALRFDETAPPELASETHALLQSWREPALAAGSPTISPIHAGVTADNDGFLALLAAGTERLLVAAVDGGGPSLDPAVVGRALTLCLGSARATHAAEIVLATEAIHSWWKDWSARGQLAVCSPAGARLRAHVAARIRSVLAEAPRHERPALTPLASRAQQALSISLGAGAERKLVALESAARRDAEWLGAIAALGDGRPARRTPQDLRILLIVLLRHSS
ncbi:MAG TPA: DEAD/DEAH box helicase [Gemmatimonadaceae bacterium]